MKHTAKRRAFARRPFPICITSLLREVADRHIQQRHGYYTVTAPSLSNPAAPTRGRLFYALLSRPAATSASMRSRPQSRG